MESDGEHWVGIGVSPEGTMNGGHGITGLSAWGVNKVNMMTGNVELMADEKQTLESTSFEQVDGKTMMKFAKLLVEDGENEIAASGPTTFLWAIGSSNDPGYHAARGAMDIDVSAAGDMDAPPTTEAPVIVDPCDFCGGSTETPDEMLDSGFTCGQTVAYAPTIEKTNEQCPMLMAMEEMCCPSGGTGPTEVVPTTTGATDVPDPTTIAATEAPPVEPESAAAGNAIAAGAIMGSFAAALLL